MCRIIENAEATTLDDSVAQAVSDKVIATDESNSYKGVRRTFGRRHGVVNHAAHEYLSGTVHTNTIEGLWSLLKRGILGTYYNVSPKYLRST